MRDKKGFLHGMAAALRQAFGTNALVQVEEEQTHETDTWVTEAQTEIARMRAEAAKASARYTPALTMDEALRQIAEDIKHA